VFSLSRFAQLRRSVRTPVRCSWLSAGESLTPERSVGDTVPFAATGSTAPAAGQAAIIVVGEREGDHDSLIQHRAAAAQPPSPSMVHALGRLTERRARTRSSELAVAGGGFALPGSK
jgi:hypothetical protein